jgi:tetratricopeptide (TPR) repeat protein
MLNDALGDGYRIEQSEQVLLFAPKDLDEGRSLLKFAELSVRRIQYALGDLACEDWLGPLVILIFADVDSYSSYVSPADPDVEFVRSAGVCFKHGYVHVAIRPVLQQDVRRILVHELTHACLSHLTLPLWLEEGITQHAASEGQFALASEDAADIRRYWHEHGLNPFWWGHGFSQFDESQHRCYQLAQILYLLIATDYRGRLSDFVRHASADDAGESAARKYLGIGLEDVAAKFLGQGAWEPTPADAATYCQRGALFSSRDQNDRALADFNAGIQLDPLSAELFINRGLTHRRLGQYADAIADYEKATQLNPRDSYAPNALAWLLATCPEDRFRDGERSLEYAHQACELSSFAPWFCLGTLAAAYAECGEFKEAQRFAGESLRLAPENEREGCKERLRTYKMRKPHREELKTQEPSP